MIMVLLIIAISIGSQAQSKVCEKEKIEHEEEKKNEKVEIAEKNDSIKKEQRIHTVSSDFLEETNSNTSSSPSEKSNNMNSSCYSVIEKDEDWAGNIDYKIRCSNGDIKTVLYNKGYNRFDNGKFPNTFNLKSLSEAAKSACGCN